VVCREISFTPEGGKVLADIEIAQQAKLKRIGALAVGTLGIPEDQIEPYGHYKAKISSEFIASLSDKPDGKLVLVTAISPTPAGEGKTTTTVGLGDALNRIGKNAMICLREPSLGPVFGMKGGAAGGGYAQVVPMEDINLHFTGDFNAIQLANNLLAAMLDNHIHHGNELGIDVRRIAWRRVLDVNDRALRSLVVAIGGPGNGYPREDRFDIVVASEVMAILCLAESMADLKQRLGKIVVAYTRDKQPVRAADLNAHGAMAVLLKDAVKPNLVQTLENNPAIVHGGPFANIAHGCNSVIATRTALKLADYVVTEAGFGADLGAEKFVDIKCRKSGLRPDACVIVATVRALKYHGGVERGALNKENVAALDKGFANLERHVRNVREVYGLPCVVSINHFTHDTDAELKLLQDKCAALGVPVVVARHWAQGGAGAEALAEKVVELADSGSANLQFVYEDDLPLLKKIEAVARKVYGAASIKVDDRALHHLEALEREGYGHFPVCIAKTQYSFSSDAGLRGAPDGHTLAVREIRLSAGAEFVVAICGEIMTMPGLPKVPAADRIDLDTDGNIVGLF
jgi:formate--tetrahydrofolate ligase